MPFQTIVLDFYYDVSLRIMQGKQIRITIIETDYGNQVKYQK